MKKIFLLLTTMFAMSISNVWGATTNYSFKNPSSDIQTSTDSKIVIMGQKVTGKTIDGSSQTVYGTEKGGILVMSKTKSISSLTFDYVGSSSSSSDSTTNFSINTISSTGTISVPTSGFTATIDGAARTDLSKLKVNGKQTSHLRFSITFDSPVSVVVINKPANNYTYVYNFSVSYDNSLSFPSSFATGHVTADNTFTATRGTLTGQTNGKGATVSSKDYYKRKGADKAFTYTLPGAQTFAAGDLIVIDVTSSGSSKSESVKIKNAILSYGVSSQAVNYVYHVVQTGDGIIGTSSFNAYLNSSDQYFYGVEVFHTSTAASHTLSPAVDPIGKGTVTLGATTVEEGATTTATYSNIDEGYEFDEWQISGAGASIDNASANPVTVTMGTADATVTLKLKVKTAKYTVIYKDGTTELGSELVEVGSNPTATGISTTKTHYTFASWQKNAVDIALDDASWASVAANAEITLTGRWTENAYANVSFRVNGEAYGDAQKVYVGEKLAAVDAPSKAGNVFKGWYNDDSKVNFNTAIAASGDITLDASWEAADANHYVYAYNDDFHFDGATYHTPEGKVDNNDGESNKAITTPYTLFSGAKGITSIIATNGIYDSKGTHVNAFLKINTGGDSKLQITIAAGYRAVLKMKMGSWDVSSKAPTTTMKDPSNETINYTGTMSGKAENHNYAELTYTLSTAGTYTLTTETKTLYISNIDLVATPIDYNVNFVAGEGSGEMEPLVKHIGDEVELPDCTFTAPDGYAFAAWTSTDVTITDNKFTMPASNVTITATYAQLYAITCAVAENGTVTADKAQAIAGETVTLTVTADPGYKVTSVKYNDVVVEPVESVYSFTMPAAAVTVTAVFSLATGIENQESKIDNRKFIKDGQLFIEKNGHVYNVFGTCIK